MSSLSKELLSIITSTCRQVACVIPPLIRLGLIDSTSCILIGMVIGIVVALRSMQFSSDRPGNES